MRLERDSWLVTLGYLNPVTIPEYVFTGKLDLDKVPNQVSLCALFWRLVRNVLIGVPMGFALTIISLAIYPIYWVVKGIAKVVRKVNQLRRSPVKQRSQEYAVVKAMLTMKNTFCPIIPIDPPDFGPSCSPSQPTARPTPSSEWDDGSVSPSVSIDDL